MCDAFNLGQDIHARTAAEVYGVPIEEVTPQMRSSAKAVNFGIVYGISDFGLSNNLHISRKEAADFIERYFARYGAVRRFMDACVAQGKAEGYSVTMYGRRRPLPELSSSNYNRRQFGERAAMNTPVQGAAADIIVMDYKPYTPFSDANIDGHMIFGMTGRQCQTTMINGKIVMKDRVLTEIDEEAVNAHVLESAKRLWGKLNHCEY